MEINGMCISFAELIVYFKDPLMIIWNHIDLAERITIQTVAYGTTFAMRLPTSVFLNYLRLITIMSLTIGLHGSRIPGLASRI